MKKKLLIVLLAVVASLCLAFGTIACSDIDDDTVDSGSNTEQTDGNSGSGSSSSGNTGNSGSSSSSSGGSTDSEQGNSSGGNSSSGNTDDDDNTEEGIKYALTSDKSFYTVISYKGSDTTIEIPRLMDGLRVVSISDNAFKNCESITNVILPNTIESIGTSAFSGCSSLKEINIPDSVTEIGEKAFYNCSALEIINEIERVETVGAEAFSGCSSLQQIAFGTYLDTIGDSAFSGCAALQKIVLCEGVTEIGTYAFDYCTSLIDITLPTTLTSLGLGAFRHAEKLKTIKIPESLTEIPNVAFQYCTSLNTIVLPDNIVSIGNSAFSYCTALQSVAIKGNIEKIGNSAFYECTALTSIYYASETQKDCGNENYIFYNAGTAGSGITLTISATAYIPEGLFEPFNKENLPKITAIIWEEGVKNIEYFNQYNYFPYLESVTLPKGISNISDGLSEMLTPIAEFNSGVYYLCGYAINFSETCTLYIDDVTIIGGRSNVRYLTIADCEQIPAGLLSGFSYLEQITIPFVGGSLNSSSASSSTLFGYIFGPNSYTGGTATLQQYSNSNSSITYYYIPTTLKSVTITGGNILYGAFYNCSNLTQVIIESAVTYVGDRAFYGCTNLTIYCEAESEPDNWSNNWNSSNCTVVWGATAQEVTYIFVINGDDEIESITSSTGITLPTPTKDGYVFDGWYDNAELEGEALSGYYYSSEDITLYAKWYIDTSELEQSDGLQIVDGDIVGIGSCTDSVLILNMPVADGAFRNCSTITKVIFGPGVTSIGNQAFAGCDNLKTVIFISDSAPQIDSDIFANTWDACDFMVYVPEGSLEAYESVSDTYWQSSIVSAGKIAEYTGIDELL